jgi:hypothetical protein
MKDFTLAMYRKLLESLLQKGYTLITFEEFIQDQENKPVVILRHDVDKLPHNALEMARIENNLDLRASYYFRAQKDSFDKEIIMEIVGLDHEIGYHYENLSTVTKMKDFRKPEIRSTKLETKENQKSEDRRQKTERNCLDFYSTNQQINKSTTLLYELAIEDFEKNLAKLREIYPVKTICMHGNPISKYDNRKLWEKYNYKDYGIIAEPYFDVDFTEVLYLTDTGRRWDGEEYSVRDKVKKEVRSQKSEDRSQKENSIDTHSTNQQINKSTSQRFDEPGSKIDRMARNENLQDKYKFRTTFDLIRAAEEGSLPDKIMINVHPQRWTNKPILWLKELVFQNIKNVVKKHLYVK